MKVFAMPGDGDLLLIQRIPVPSCLPHAGKPLPTHGSYDSLPPCGAGPGSIRGESAIPMHPLDGRPAKNTAERLTCIPFAPAAAGHRVRAQHASLQR